MSIEKKDVLLANKSKMELIEEALLMHVSGGADPSCGECKPQDDGCNARCTGKCANNGCYGPGHEPSSSIK